MFKKYALTYTNHTIPNQKQLAIGAVADILPLSVLSSFAIFLKIFFKKTSDLIFYLERSKICNCFLNSILSL